MSEYRILRDRSAAIERAIDRRPPPQEGTARRLVSIIDQGAIPISPDHFFACNPVNVGGAETESGSPVFAIDATQVLYVDVLGGVPAVGDLLTAYAVGGRWVAERGASAPSALCQWFCGPEVIFAPGSPTARGVPVVSSSGTITGVRVTAGGTYATAPVVTFVAPPPGGTLAHGTAVLTAGAVTGVTMTNPGAGYIIPAPVASLDLTLSGNGISYGPFTLTPLASPGGTWPYGGSQCIFSVTAPITIPATTVCPAYTTSITATVSFNALANQWILLITLGFGFALAPVMNCGPLFLAMGCPGPFIGSGNQFNAALPFCGSRPYSYSAAFSAAPNFTAQQQALLYLMFGGYCSGGTKHPATIVVNFTLSES